MDLATDRNRGWLDGENRMRRRVWSRLLTILCAGLLAGAAGRSGWCAQSSETPDHLFSGDEGMPLNWDLPTLGGMQFWTDLRHRSGWRIQQHCTTRHCRLIDAADVRRAWGTLQQCEDAMEQRIAAGEIAPNRGTVVILAHGLARTRGCWLPMTEHLKKNSDWQVIDFTHASTRLPISRHAAALRSLIDSLGPEVGTVHLVGHSMGNIVFRHYLGDTTDPQTGAQGDPRIQRIVMIAPPNQGSKMARVLQPTGLYPLLTGRSGVELGRDWEKIAGRLAVPRCEFGIVAGGDPESGRGYNPLLEGGDDMTVSLGETRLAGARDMLVHPWLHPTIMKEPEVCEATLRFLRTGCFSESGICHPVPAGEPGSSSPLRSPERP